MRVLAIVMFGGCALVLLIAAGWWLAAERARVSTFARSLLARFPAPARTDPDQPRAQRGRHRAGAKR